jgi:hypothetical protein
MRYIVALHTLLMTRIGLRPLPIYYCLKKICQMSVVDYNYGARGDGLRINDIDRTDIYDGV